MGDLGDSPVGLVLAFGSGMATQWFAHWLSGRRGDAIQIRNRARQELDEAYQPAIQLLGTVIADYPKNKKARESLLELMHTKAAYFDPADRNGLWVAASDLAQLDDLTKVDERLRKGQKERSALAAKKRHFWEAT